MRRITPTQAAEIKGVHRSTIHRACNRGDLPFVWAGRQKLILNGKTFKKWNPKR